MPVQTKVVDIWRCSGCPATVKVVEMLARGDERTPLTPPKGWKWALQADGETVLELCAECAKKKPVAKK